MRKSESVFRADRLAQLQGQRNQQEFADYLGINQSQLQKYLSGRSEPTVAVITRMASRARVSSDWLLGLSDKATEQMPFSRGNLILLLSTLPQDELDRIERLIDAMLPPQSGKGKS